MIRKNHFWYDLHNALSSPKFLIGLLAVTGLPILYIDFQFIYPTLVLFVTLFAGRGLIGRRCPHCDIRLKEDRAEQDKKSAFILHIIWRCPRCGYEEDEETKGDAGLFGVS